MALSTLVSLQDGRAEPVTYEFHGNFRSTWGTMPADLVGTRIRGGFVYDRSLEASPQTTALSAQYHHALTCFWFVTDGVPSGVSESGRFDVQASGQHSFTLYDLGAAEGPAVGGFALTEFAMSMYRNSPLFSDASLPVSLPAIEDFDGAGADARYGGGRVATYDIDALEQVPTTGATCEELFLSTPIPEICPGHDPDLDADGDGTPDGCDDDDDGDGVDDDQDACPNTAGSAPIDASGCTGTQYVALRCEDLASTSGARVSCVAQAASDAVRSGLLTHQERAALLSEAARSR